MARVFCVSARYVAAAGDGRPQDVLRQARPVAHAGSGRLPAKHDRPEVSQDRTEPVRQSEEARRGRRAVIITRSPLRISLGGGGTDLPSYYQDHSGLVLAAAIDKY